MNSILNLFLFLLAFQLTHRCIDTVPITGGISVRSMNKNPPPYKFMVSLQELSGNPENTDKIYQHFCGGSLIGSEWILTAAHCMYRKNIPHIVALIGFEVLSEAKPEDYHELDRVVYNGFQTMNYQNDIALVHLKKRYDDDAMNWAKLPLWWGMKATRNAPCKTIGYGASNNAGDTQNNLMEIEVKIVGKNACRNILGHVWAPKNHDKTICAVGENHDDTCQGDSGGPLLCRFNTDYYIFGLVSYGISCGLKGVPSIFTVTPPYLNWIREVTGNKP